VNVWGALVGGVVGTLVLTSGLRAASELGLTRMDLPFLLGTAMTGNRVRAKAVGYGMHFGFGLLFALAYWVVFRVLDESGWLFGAALGLLHGVFAATALVNVLLPLVHPRMATPLTAAGQSPLLEPPGFLMLNYGRATPAVTIAGHVAYGAIVGGFVSVAS
jgi:apolipoprotein N-acyltransferase